MNGRLLSWHSEVRHLGNFFNNRLCNSTDSNQKASHFIGQFNKLYSNFGYLQANVLSNLFKSYCCSFYGSFYGCIIPMDLKNVVRSGIRLFVKYFHYLISHIDGLLASFNWTISYKQSID